MEGSGCAVVESAERKDTEEAAGVLRERGAAHPNEDYDAGVAAEDEQRRRAAEMYEALSEEDKAKA
eukprot:COSAG04_NODE_11893_length_682_cov_1.133791_1_plen_65_part_10